jgi:hypothetical protein
MPRFPDTPTTGSHDVFAERRQTHRVQISMPVLVRRARGNGVFLEEARTVAVNSQGCVLWLTADVGREDPLHSCVCWAQAGRQNRDRSKIRSARSALLEHRFSSRRLEPGRSEAARKGPAISPRFKVKLSAKQTRGIFDR